MTTKHTPGPWTFTQSGTGQTLICGSEAPDQITEARYDFIAEVYRRSSNEQRFKGGKSRWINDGESEANARLIASAPELLEALKNALEGLETLKPSAGIYTAPCESAIEFGKNIIREVEELQ